MKTSGIIFVLYVLLSLSGCKTTPIVQEKVVPKIHSSGITDLRGGKNKNSHVEDKIEDDAFAFLANTLTMRIGEKISLSSLVITKFNMVVTGDPYVDTSLYPPQAGVADVLIAEAIVKEIKDTGKRTVIGEIAGEYKGVSFSSYAQNEYSRNDVKSAFKIEFSNLINKTANKIESIIVRNNASAGNIAAKIVNTKNENKSVTIIFERESRLFGDGTLDVGFNNVDIVKLAIGDKYTIQTMPGMHSFSMANCTSSYLFEDGRTYHVYLASYCFDIKVNGEKAWP